MLVYWGKEKQFIVRENFIVHVHVSWGGSFSQKIESANPAQLS